MTPRPPFPFVLAALALGALTAVTAFGDATAPVARRPKGDEAKLSLPLSPEARAVVDLRAEGKLQVDALVRTLASARDDGERRAIQARIGQIKFGTDLKVLRLRAAQARAKGDLATAQQLDLAGDAMEHPKAPDASAAQSIDKRITPERRQP